MMLSLKDFKGRSVHGSNSPLKMLADVAEVAAEKYGKEKASKKRGLPNGRPELPDGYKNRIKAMGGTEVDMVIQKALTATDVNKCQARLSMPFTQLVNKDFLREKEKDYFRQQKEISVPFIDDPSGPTLDGIVLRQCDMQKVGRKTSSMYVLKKRWNDVTLRKNLQADDVVQLWSFRLGSEEQRLCLALVVVSTKGSPENEAQSSGA